VEGSQRSVRLHRHHEPHHLPCRLDAKKKSLGATERNEEQRAQFRERLRDRDGRDFVIIDESGTNLNLTPRFARSPRGTRAYGSVPRNTPPNTTLIASLTTQGMGAAMVVQGATDRAAFEVYLERFLVPSLRVGQVVVMDNLSAHKSERVQRLIEERGCEVWYLPSYSPDLSPIELAFSKLKEWLRRTKARTKEALEEGIACALNEISASDARGYFRHCGYRCLDEIAQ
jgi:transposase